MSPKCFSTTLAALDASPLSGRRRSEGDRGEIYMEIHEDEYLQRRHVYEEHAYVLDFLPYGRSSEKSRHLAVPTVQIMGEQFFTLLEAELKIGATVLVHERIYIGRDRREKIDRILTRISNEQGSATSRRLHRRESLKN